MGDTVHRRRMAQSYRDALAAMDAARNFPAGTCPASRHAAIMAEELIRHGAYPQLQGEPEHCGESIAATVTALWKARAEVESLRLAEEGAKEAFGVVVQEKRDLEAEVKRLQVLLDAAYAQIWRAGRG